MGIPLNIVDIKNLESKFEMMERDLERELRKVRYKRGQINRKLKENDNTDQKWIVEISEDCMPERKERVGKPLNWKKMVWSIFQIYPLPMTSEMVSNKLILHYDEVPLDRRILIRNVSAALHYLEGKDRKLYRIKLNRKKEFVYGLKEFFSLELQPLNLQLKPGPLRDYLLEEGNVELGTTVNLQHQSMNKTLINSM